MDLKFSKDSELFKCRLCRKAGKHILLGKNVHLRGIKFVSVGSSVTFGEYSIITAYKSIDKVPKLNFGNNCNIGPYNHITCINEIKIGDGFLSGRWVTITDNSHGSNTFSEQLIPPGERSLFSKGAIVIGKNVLPSDSNVNKNGSDIKEPEGQVFL